jgi:HEAT repeat protein
MRKKWRIILISLLIVIVVVLAWLVPRPGEPIYQGKTLTFWLQQEVDNGGLDPEAETAIRAIGPEAIPELLRMLGTKDTHIRNGLRTLAQKFKWFPIRPRSREQALQLGINGFWALGPIARPALPELMRLLGDPDSQVRAYAAMSIGRIGAGAQSSIPPLIDNLSAISITNAGQQSLEVRGIALALAEMGPAAQAAIPTLNSLTNVFGVIGPATRAAIIKIRGDSIQPYLEVLKDTSKVTDWLGAATTMMFLGTNADSAVPVLVAALPQTNIQMSHIAFLSLSRIRTQPDLCIPAIIPFLQSTNVMARSDAIEAIRAFGVTSNRLGVAEIAKCLNDPDPVVEKRAERALKQIDPAAAKPAAK